MQNPTKYKWLNPTKYKWTMILHKQYKFGCKQKIDIHLRIQIYSIYIRACMKVITYKW